MPIEPYDDEAGVVLLEPSAEQRDAAFLAHSANTIPITYSDGGQVLTMMTSAAMLDRVMKLRAESKTDRQIARILGFSRPIITAMLKVALAHTGEMTMAELRQLEMQKLEVLEQETLALYWVAKEAGNAAGQTRALHAISQLVKINESRRKLLGLDAPQVIEQLPVQVTINGVNVEDI